jgi:hypothetical protein
MMLAGGILLRGCPLRRHLQWALMPTSWKQDLQQGTQQ